MNNKKNVFARLDNMEAVNQLEFVRAEEDAEGRLKSLETINQQLAF